MELKIHSNNMEEIAGVTAEYPFVLNHADSNEMRVPWHWHEELEFGYVLKGSLKVLIAGQSYIFKKGEGFFINTDILHMMEPENPEEGVVWESYLFHSVFLAGHFRSVFETKYIEPVLKNRKIEIVHFTGKTKNHGKILDYLKMVSTYDSEPDQELRIRNAFSEIWICLLDEISVLEKNPRQLKAISQERIQAMLSFIHINYNQKLSLEQIAGAAFISSRECIRCFQSCIGKTPFEYLLEYRIQVAEKLLRTSDKTITEIALQTGFNSSAYFTKIFRQLKGMTPGKYKNNS